MTMKKITILTMVLISVILITNFGFSQDLRFFPGSWEEANDLAAKENKYIMLDAYNDWCGWCKVMDKELFTDSTIVSFIEKHFIPVKINFEDSLGIVLAMKFRVTGFPTLLLFNQHGQLIHRINGYMENHVKFIDELQYALDIKEERPFAFDSRNLDLDYPAIYKNNFYRKKPYKHPTDSVVTAYLDTQDDLFSEINWSIFSVFWSNKYNQHFLNNYEKYKLLYGKMEVEDNLESIIDNRVQAAIDSNSIILLNEHMLLCDKAEDAELLKNLFRMFYFEGTKDWDEYVKELALYVEREGIAEPMMINYACWEIYENAEDKYILNQAIKWMERVIEEHPIYMHMDTYAALLYKYGELDKAEKIARKAIQLGINESDEDVGSTEKLLEKIMEEKNEVR